MTKPAAARTLVWGWLATPLLGLATAVACCMVPTQFPGDVDQSRQDGLVLHHAGHEELILRVSPTFSDSSYGPERLAWIVTVPSTPLHYDAIDGQAFDDAKALYRHLEALATEQEPRVRGPGAALGRTPAPSSAVDGKVEVDPVVRVGPYEITPVRAHGPEGARALNLYLHERGFPAESPEELAWFTEREFTFLCVDIHPPESEKTLGTDLELPALKIGFASDTPYYPLKYSARQGNFKLDLNIITSRPLDRRAFRTVRKKLNSRGGRWQNLYTMTSLPRSIADAAKTLPGSDTVKKWHVNALPSWGFNERDASGTPAIARWDDDIFLPLGGPGDAPPDWYFGDGPRPRSSKMIVAVVVLALMMAGVIGFVVLGQRRRRDPRSPG